MSYSNKNYSELSFWRYEIQQYLHWFTGAIPVLYNTPSPASEQKIYTDNLITSAILTWTELHQKPKYLHDLDMSASTFQNRRVLDVGAGPIPSGTCFDGCELYAADPLHYQYQLLGFPQHLYSKVHFLQCHAEEIPIEDHFFDAVMAVNAIDHVDNLEAVAKELCRVSKKDCLFAMNVHYHHPTDCEPIEITNERFAALFSWVAGLRVVSRADRSFSVQVKEGEQIVLWRNF